MERKTPDPTIAVRVPREIRDWMLEVARKRGVKLSSLHREILAEAWDKRHG